MSIGGVIGEMQKGLKSYTQAFDSIVSEIKKSNQDVLNVWFSDNGGWHLKVVDEEEILKFDTFFELVDFVNGNY